MKKIKGVIIIYSDQIKNFIESLKMLFYSFLFYFHVLYKIKPIYVSHFSTLVINIFQDNSVTLIKFITTELKINKAINYRHDSSH